MADTPAEELKKVTIRRFRGGKAHRAFQYPDGAVHAACSCPGSQNGSLVNRSQVVAEGWEKANCERSKQRLRTPGLLTVIYSTAALAFAIAFVAHGYAVKQAPVSIVKTAETVVKQAIPAYKSIEIRDQWAAKICQKYGDCSGIAAADQKGSKFYIVTKADNLYVDGLWDSEPTYCNPTADNC